MVSGAHQRIQAVERLIQHQHARIVSDGLGQFDALPHALAVARNFAMRGLAQVDAPDGKGGGPLAIRGGHAGEPQDTTR